MWKSNLLNINYMYKKNLKDINGVIGIRKDKQHKVQGKGKKDI
jgi:hypothetical protein